MNVQLNSSVHAQPFQCGDLVRRISQSPSGRQHIGTICKVSEVRMLEYQEDKVKFLIRFREDENDAPYSVPEHFELV